MISVDRFRTQTLLPSILILVVCTSTFASCAQIGKELPDNVKWTKQAWDAFNLAKYENAITIAEKCINEFQGAADRDQAQLEKEQTPPPPKDKFSDQEKNIILARGPLNDVATCLYIKGRSSESLGRKEEAKQAYQAASKYTYARCWDPKGWFWSPAEAASDRLSLLK